MITFCIHDTEFQINMIILLVLPNLKLGNFGCGPILIRQTCIYL